MHIRGLSLVVAGSLVLAGCQTHEGQVAGEGCGIGALVGAGLGAAIGGDWKSAALGAVAGCATGAAGGEYIAQRQKQYADIQSRIAGETQVSMQATETANAQTEASRANLQVVEAQLAKLHTDKAGKIKAQDKVGAMIASLEKEHKDLAANRDTLTKLISDQQAYIARTEKEIGTRDPAKVAQLQAWKDEIPNMQTAVSAMAKQLADISELEVRLQATQPTS